MKKQQKRKLKQTQTDNATTGNSRDSAQAFGVFLPRPLPSVRYAHSQTQTHTYIHTFTQTHKHTHTHSLSLAPLPYRPRQPSSLSSWQTITGAPVPLRIGCAPSALASPRPASLVSSPSVTAVTDVVSSPVVVALAVLLLPPEPAVRVSERTANTPG